MGRAGGRDFGAMSSTLDWDWVGGNEAVVEVEDEELTRIRPPVRRGGGGGGTFEMVAGGDCVTALGAIIT